MNFMPAKTSESEFRGTAKRASREQLKFLDSRFRGMTKSRVVQSFPGLLKSGLRDAHFGNAPRFAHSIGRFFAFHSGKPPRNQYTFL